MTDYPARRRQIPWLLLAVYWTGLFASTHLKLPTDVPLTLSHADKLLHFGAYAGLALLISWALQSSWRSPMCYAVALVVLAVYAAADEWSQTFVASREADPWDAVADVCGAAAGLCFYAAVRRLRRSARPV